MDKSKTILCVDYKKQIVGSGNINIQIHCTFNVTIYFLHFGIIFFHLELK